MPTTQETRHVQGGGSQGNALADSQLSTKQARLSPCQHLDKAAHWLQVAENAFGFGENAGGLYMQAARLAELHIMMADRADFRGQCDD
jgi:hypothetical protein